MILVNKKKEDTFFGNEMKLKNYTYVDVTPFRATNKFKIGFFLM